jgi:hypothetical protein
MRPALLLLALAGCGDDPCAGTRDLLASPSALTLTEAEHELGWGRSECFQCHQQFRIHEEDCIDVAAVDGAAIDEASDPDDTTTCVPCHGSNGVPGW